MNISTTDARGLFTKTVIDTYRQKPSPTTFLRSFFPTKTSPTKELAIEVEREGEPIAVDVVRGTEGNRNTFSRSTEKIFVPPYYREYFDATDLDLYDRLFASPSIEDSVFMAFAEKMVERMTSLQNKIERSYELQCSQVLTTGIVTLNQGINIDFKRKALSLVDLGSGNYWIDSGVDPVTSLLVGCNFLRQTGKSMGSVFNLTLGDTALIHLIDNVKVQDRGKIYNYALDLITPPQRNSVGASLHGELSVGSYRVRLWSYPQYYDLAGVSTPYIDPKKVILLPETPRFRLGFAAVPQLYKGNPVPKQGEFIVGEYMDERNTAHIFDLKSAGVAIPIAVDQIWTAKVVA